MMVSRKVFWGATWPLRTGIFAAGAVLLSTSEDSAGLEVVSHRHCPAPHPPLSPLHLAAERTTVPLSFSESDPPDLVSDNPEEGGGGLREGGVESKLSPKWLERGTDAWCSLARRWSVQGGSVAAAELSVVSNSSRKRCDRIFVLFPEGRTVGQLGFPSAHTLSGAQQPLSSCTTARTAEADRASVVGAIVGPPGCASLFLRVSHSTSSSSSSSSSPCTVELRVFYYGIMVGEKTKTNKKTKQKTRRTRISGRE